MGRTAYIVDADGFDHGLYDHEGYVAYWDPACGNWCATWGGGHAESRTLARAQCECGWHGSEHPAPPELFGLDENDEQRVMEEWDDHVDPLLRALASGPARRQAVGERLGLQLGQSGDGHDFVSVRLSSLERLADRFDRHRGSREV